MNQQRADFIDEIYINGLLEEARTATLDDARRIIDKAGLCKGLTPEETAVLLHAEDRKILEGIYHQANRIKESIYGKRLVFSLPCTSVTTASIIASIAVTGGIINSNGVS